MRKPKQEKKAKFDAWILKYKHSDQLNTFTAFRYIVEYLLENPANPFEEVVASVEDTPWFQRLLQGKRPDTPRPKPELLL